MDGHEHDDQAFLDSLRAALISATTAERLTGGNRADTLLEMIVRAAARAIPCPEGALFLVDRQRRVLTFEVVIGSTADAVKDMTVPLGHGIAGLVAASGQALAIANAQDDPRHARDVAERSGYLPTTILAVPVAGEDGATIGVLELLDRQGQPTFSLADLELLGMFAGQVSVVLEMRRAQTYAGARLAGALSTLGGIPSNARAALQTQAVAFDERITADPAAQRAAELADLVGSVASRGAEGQDLCIRILGAVSDYLDAQPELGTGMFR